MKEHSENYLNKFPFLGQLSLVITEMHMYIFLKTVRLRM